MSPHPHGAPDDSPYDDRYAGRHEDRYEGRGQVRHDDGRDGGAYDGRYDDRLPERQVALVDLLDRLLSGGVVLAGDLVLSVAGIDLVRISLRALIVSVGEETADRGSGGRPT
ncbi:gas vesicle protein [Streptomyces sp. NPDC058052]|uniref:gas vesicle protein n=1 Tax=Streptomyces sp. NPDC058052 TaxID=3346316 RepID=UPI0036EEEC48